jgi:amino acid transporter
VINIYFIYNTIFVARKYTDSFILQILKYKSAINFYVIKEEVFHPKKEYKHLGYNQLSLRHAVSQAIGLNAPGGTIVLYVAGTAALLTFTFSKYPDGAFSIPLILLLALIVYSMMSYSSFEFSKYLSSSGGYYTFVANGLGKGLGLTTALSYISYQILSFTGFGILGFIGFAYAILPSIGITVPFVNILWIPVTIVFILFVSFLIYKGIKPSLKYVSYAILIEVIFFIATSIYLIGINHTAISIKPFTAIPVGGNFLILAAMMVYAIGSFVGVGGSIPIAEETKNPKKTVPRSIIASIAILGVTIVLAAYAEVISWGYGNMPTFGTGSGIGAYPVLSIYKNGFSGMGLIPFAILLIIVINSFFTATVSLGTNASRVIFSLSREGVVPEKLSRTNIKGVPVYAILFITVISLTIVLATGISFELLYPGQIIDALLYSSVFLLVLESPISYIVHILTNTSLHMYLKKRGEKTHIFRHIIIPGISSITLVGAIIAAVYFDLSAPYIYGIYGALAWIVVIGITVAVMYTKYKKNLENIGDFSL